LNGHARNVLRRFPAHLEATREGKRLGEVSTALALDLDTLGVALARVRRARRLSDSDELRDLLRVGALHGITASELGVLFARLSRALSDLESAKSSDGAAEALLALWGIKASPPPLASYTSRDEAVAFAELALSNDVLLDGVRQRIKTICKIHAGGNGTVHALVQGAANALDLDVVALVHDQDRYLHAATVRDRLRLRHPASGGDAPAEQEFAPASEHLLVEENPHTPVQTGDQARKHAELFSVLRRGFERETLGVRITGVEERTRGPMLVNRDEGHGVGFSGAVPNGATLRFSEEGRVSLDAADVTSLAFAWRGGCFADGAAARPSDFVFDGPGAAPERRARFALSSPAGALGASFAFPHAGDSLPMPGISVGETRFAYFVQQAHFSRRAAPRPPALEGEIVRVEPRPQVGFLDAAVFAPGPGVERPVAGAVALTWHERAAFWVNVWIPKRFIALTPDATEGRDTLEHVALALHRFRPAGVHVEVKFLDERWVLGRGVTISEESTGGEIAGPGSGTELWSAPSE
jgi:hypothetical protein